MPRIIDFDHGVSAIDAGHVRPGLAAIHLVVEGGQAALVDAGTAYSVPLVLEALEVKGISRGNVAFLFLTHVHLDHAGGAGALVHHLPNAQVIVHPRGLKHLIDPGKLVAGTRAVYGDMQFERLYGEVLPVAPERLVEAKDGDSVALGGRCFLFLDTPGHARHHNCIFDEKSACFFTGDAFGISYRELDAYGKEFVFPTSTPTQFDPDAAHASIDRLMGYRPRYCYLAHFSRINRLEEHAQTLHELLEEYRRLGREAASSGQVRHTFLVKELEQLLVTRARLHGCRLPENKIRDLLAMDIDLNALGIETWIKTAGEPARFAQTAKRPNN